MQDDIEREGHDFNACRFIFLTVMISRTDFPFRWEYAFWSGKVIIIEGY